MLNLRAQLANGFSLESIVFPSSHFQKLLESLNIHNETENKKMMIEMMCTAYGMITANNYTKKLF